MYILECHEGVTPEKLTWVDEALGHSEAEVVMTAGERLRQEGWERGRKDGREEGQRRVLLKLLGLRFGQLSPEVVVPCA